MTDERMGGAQPLGYHIETYGCQMNVRDSETMAGLLESLGMRRAASMQEADVIVFNTCCVRDHAERRVFGNVGFTRLIKEERPDAVIAVCGCMMQQREVAVRLFDRFPFVSLVFGTHVLHRLPEMIRRALAGERLCVTDEDDLSIVEGLPARRAPGQSAFVNIMFGCNNFCTYCIVPYVRGRERSRTPEAVEQEVRALAQEGYTEITLLGQNVNSYGRGLPEGTDFPALLRRPQRRGRHPAHPLHDVAPEGSLRRTDRGDGHARQGLPAHPSAAAIRLGRRFAGDEPPLYARAVCRDGGKAARGGAGGGADDGYHRGLPGETEEDFLDTMDMMRRIGFAAAYTFQYSPRAGTRAAAMPEQVPSAVKRERLHRLNALQAEMTERNNRAYIGRGGEVLVEGAGKRAGAQVAFGKLPNFKMVYFPGNDELIGRYLPVRVTGVKGNSLFGEREEERA